MVGSINDKFFNGTNEEIRVDTGALREKINSDVDAYLANGGVIQQVNKGVRSIDLNDFNNTGKKRAAEKRKRGSERGGQTKRLEKQKKV